MSAQKKALPRLSKWITKFVEEEWFEATLRGEIRIGTLSGYRADEEAAADGTLADRLSDTGEGVQTRYTTDRYFEDYVGRGGLVLRDVRVEGHQQSLAIIEKDSGLVFCATHGQYRTSVHRRIVEKNPKLTHWVSLRVKEFTEALIQVRALVEGASQDTPWLCSLVEYDDDGRMSEESQQSLSQAPQRLHGFMRATFVKPRRFIHEEEIRFALYVAKKYENAILTAKLPASIRQRIVGAMVGSGRLRA